MRQITVTDLLEETEDSNPVTHRFLHLDLINLYSEQFVLEVIVEDEMVGVFHILALKINQEYS